MTKKQRERLERLLLVVPYILRHQKTEQCVGVKLGELRRKFNIHPRRLAADLKFLSRYVSPEGETRSDEYVDAYIEEGEAFIFGPLNFKGPMALKPREWFALLGAAEFVRTGANDPLGLGLRRLAEKLGRLPAADVKVNVRGRAATRSRAALFGKQLAALRLALEAGQMIDMAYYSRSVDRLRRLSVSPHHLFMLDGEWYLAANQEGQRLKTYRVDRMREISPSRVLISAACKAAYRLWAARGETFSFRDELLVVVKQDQQTAELRGDSPGRLLDLYFRRYRGWRVCGSSWFSEVLRGKLDRMLEAYS
jgi:predicted DNA-binding transcriptional regulator YafY